MHLFKLRLFRVRLSLVSLFIVHLFIVTLLIAHLFLVHCNYLLIYEYVIGNQNNNPWKNIARALATKHLELVMDEEEELCSGRSTPQQTVSTKNQDRTLLLGGKCLLSLSLVTSGDRCPCH